MAGGGGARLGTSMIFRESVEPSQEAKYWADQIGAFEVHYEDGGSSGNKVLKQMVPALPIGWSDHGSNGPMTLIGGWPLPPLVCLLTRVASSK